MKSSHSKLFTPASITIIVVVLAMAVYFLGARHWLPGSSILAIELILIGGLVVLSAGTLLFLLGS